ncbi:MAG: transketolase [Paludibacteraceae bacterium]|nr:transketolase [Paludibacteraceae bacterium]
MKENSSKQLKRAADNIRILAASMVEKAKSGHPGGAMGGADFINVLFSEFLVYDPEKPLWEGRDRFFLDPGHMSPMLYSVLACAGKYTMDDLKNFRQWGSITPGHPERDIMHGIENTSGPLGQGHVYAVGAAIASKFLNARMDNILQSKIYAYISDGGIQEEISQGAGRIAGTLGLNNLIMFYDSNNVQLSTMCNEVSNEDVARKYTAWGWKVLTCDGHSVSSIRRNLKAAINEKERPVLIIGTTTMGKGALREDGSSYENCPATHGSPLGGQAYTNTITALGGDPENPFVLFDETKEIYERRREALRKIVTERYQKRDNWAMANPVKAAKLSKWFSGIAPHIDWTKAKQKPDTATRAASATCLSALADQVENMIVSSADLSNSDKTDGFLKKTHAFKKGDFSGAFLQAGVSELTMACLCIGMTLHGGVIAACGTFFVFSDYMKPAIRMAALMQLPVKFIWSHDAFRVGEDGPTHEPVEQEAQLRLMEKLHNHAGMNSMLVLRPADAKETTECYRLMMENTSTPTGIILSRQNITDLPDTTNYSLVRNGGYVVSEDKDPEYTLIATGSEVSTLVQVAKIVREKGHRVSIVSVPSEGLFFNQPEEYRNKVIPKNVKRFGLTAGLPVNLINLVGTDGTIYGLESFGFSAPYKVLDEKLGFTPEQVAARILAL